MMVLLKPWIAECSILVVFLRIPDAYNNAVFLLVSIVCIQSHPLNIVELSL